MLVLRSLLFNVVFYVNLVVLVFLGIPRMFMGRQSVENLARLWARTSLWWARVICDMRFEVRGLENIPDGAVIVAAKHQSVWETYVLTLFLKDFSYVLKRELTWIPLFGWYLIAGEQIAIDRSKGSSALSQVSAAATKLLAEGRQLFIFPEGTRRPAGAPPAYKYGVAHVYATTGARCLPVAVNSGLFWARRSFLRRPGTVVMSFLPVIEPGLTPRDFLAELSDRIETETNRLNAEAVARDPSLAAVLEQGAKTT
ncbi:MAG: 1-acyl-sn-glycerol-3-phosphate acyltransferase [Rhodoblastus sp.]|nr:MAG: 1-acyl-sn-glycerol-3-phosphate acyltransferase [Rhodoblastus sp.]